MIVYVFPADMYGCGFYRMLEPARVLKAAGIDVRVIEPNMRDGIGGDTDMATGKLVNARIPADADVIVMQRVTMSLMAEAVPMIRRQGVAVVVDMDDDLSHIDPSNPAFTGLHPKLGRSGGKHSWRHAASACLEATAVTTSTPELARRYAPHGRSTVLYNRIPASYLDVEHVDSEAIGWPGSVHSHPLDLQQVGSAVARLQRDGIPYRGVGSIVGLREALGLDTDPQTTGDVELGDWASAVAQIGVGMAPLVDTTFNAAKSWLKVLEMSAVGVPWVASPRVEYRRFSVLHRVGLLAEKPKDWYRQLKRLASDSELRAEQSAAGREAGRLNTYEEHAWRWAEVWQDAMTFERRRRPALRGVAS
jgi:hypothetical protein